MQVGGVLTESRAVSPVIGVILMVSITVVLAAVLGTLALGLGGTTESVPQARFEFQILEKSSSPDELRVTHAGGDAVPNTELYLTMDEVQIQDESGPATGPFERMSWYQAQSIGPGPAVSSGDPVSAGDSVLVEPPDAPASNEELEDKTLRVVWQSADSDRTATLRVWRGPVA
jgi:flagellin-like protein